ncbi:MAG TPA: LuxR C-terminal-related transcriptional regulator [Candidatus Methylacidiphilales bacterium]|nr:LuxR C-terminal-related transcriptional regulator [Candidatus Methylacidiphilales bacterium]
MPIDPATWSELFAAVYEVNAASSHSDFAGAVVSGMSRLISAEVSIYQLLDRTSGHFMTRIAPFDPYSPEEVEYFTRHSEENPLVAYYQRTGDLQARRLSDVIDVNVWMESTYYQTCVKRLDLRHCLALPVVVNESIVASFSFGRRGNDFSQHECELLDAFGPHFRQAWFRHENPWRDQKSEEMSVRSRFTQLGINTRESEVLYWMTEGKLNREIAVILGIRLGTVQDHVANILLKLEQENRHAATVFALKLLQSK